MTYEDLKVFCNSLTDEQLKQEVWLTRTDDAPVKVICGHITEQDEWFDHCDSMGFEKDLKAEYGDEWENEAEDFTKVPAGTVTLCDE